MKILAALTPLDPATGERPILRAASADDPAITGLNDVRWWPAISQMPSLGIKLFDGNFTSNVDSGGATFSVLMDKLVRMDANALGYRWAGARVTLYSGEAGDTWPWPVLFSGTVDRFEQDAGTLKLQASVDTEPFEKDALTAAYAGTGGKEGDANLKNKVKPWVFGRALNVEPVLINVDDNVLQFSAYGPIQAINALYERGSSFGAPVANYTTYAELVAAAIPNGRWATCLAEGLVRLGAPPFGVITGDVDGDKPSGVWLRTTGAIIKRIAANAGVDPAVMDMASLDALDVAVPYDINLVLAEQTSVLDIARRLARPCNAQVGVSWTGKLFAVRVAIPGTAAITLDAMGRRAPRVSSSVEVDVSPPYWRIEMGGERCWRVHTLDEISFDAQLVERGRWESTKTYREGDVVDLADGSRWFYVASSPTAGNPPLAGSAFWSNLTPAMNPGQNALYNGGFRLDLAGWSASGWYLSKDWRGNLLQPPQGTGGLFVAPSTMSIGVSPGEMVTLSASFTGFHNSGAQFMFVDIEWRNGGNGALLSYSSTPTHGGAGDVSWLGLGNWTGDRKHHSFAAPFPSDGSGFVKGYVRVASFTDFAATDGLHGIGQIKVENGSQPTAFSDEATDGANMGNATGRFDSGTYLPTNWNIGIKALRVSGFVLSDSAAGATVNVNVGASTYLLDDGRSINYPTATLAGLAYGVQYFVWRNDPNMDGGTSYGVSTALQDATGPGKAYMGYFTTRATSGGTGGGGSGGRDYCVAHGMHVRAWGCTVLAEQVETGVLLRTLDGDLQSLDWTPVESNEAHENECVAIRTRLGAELTLALNTPCVTESGAWVIAANAWMARLPVLHHGELIWDDVVALDYAGLRPVAAIKCHNATYAAGADPDLMILTHNPIDKP